MQDATTITWPGASQRSPSLRESLRELNCRFLNLLAAEEWRECRRAGLSLDLSTRIAPLSSEQKAAAADCPYALFDLRFRDEEFWCSRDLLADPWQVADRPATEHATLNFVHVALFFAWHVAATDHLSAQLLLGMSERTSNAFRDMTVDCLPSLAASEAIHLSARWCHCHAFWTSLVSSAARANPRGLRKVQLYGLQLAAAARLN